LLEALVATALLATALAALGQMFGISIANNTAARTNTFAAILAEQKMEQLRGLTWGFDTLGLPLTDTTSNTALPTETANGGTGLSPSPGNALTANVDGYVDYVDQFGRILGGGAVAPARTVYIRRWSVEPLPTNPNNTIVLQVLVTRVMNRGNADTDGSTMRLKDEARLMSVKTRKAL
jgi:hypothetical protein